MRICGKAGCNRQLSFVLSIPNSASQSAYAQASIQQIYNAVHSVPFPPIQSPPPSRLTMSYSSIHKASLVESSTHSPALLELVDQKMTRPIVGKSLGSVSVAWQFPKTLSQNISSMRS